LPRFLASLFVLPLLLFGADQQSTVSSNKNYVLVWHDEFDGRNGSLPDPKKWIYDLGGGGWGNQELESYTNRAENAHIENGNLVITARKENFEGSDHIAREFTSARLKTQGLFSQTYGRFEARIKIPSGQGMWPAFWMMGDNISSVGWPKCGEIDIMENVGKEPGLVHGSLHGPMTTGAATDLTSTVSLPTGKDFAAAYHLYAVEWEPDAVRFYVDDTLYATFTAKSVASTPTTAGSWVFDHPYFLILNVAVGGSWPGPPDATSAFPQTMLIDYVRVYTAKR
jgi:beta-glucanase (GH16 family)